MYTNSLGSLFAFLGIILLFFLAIMVLMVISTWKVYEKTGRPGWASIVPIYNLVVLLEIVGKPTWWVLLYLIPFVNIIISIIVLHNLSKVFGQDVGFTLGLIFLPFIFYPILAFGKYSYTDPLLTPPSQPQTTANVI
jgi:hypothetical protein